jgi:hypothetical protein
MAATNVLNPHAAVKAAREQLTLIRIFPLHSILDQVDRLSPSRSSRSETPATAARVTLL